MVGINSTIERRKANHVALHIDIMNTKQLACAFRVKFISRLANLWSLKCFTIFSVSLSLPVWMYVNEDNNHKSVALWRCRLKQSNKICFNNAQHPWQKKILKGIPLSQIHLTIAKPQSIFIEISILCFRKTNSGFHKPNANGKKIENCEGDVSDWRKTFWRLI